MLNRVIDAEINLAAIMVEQSVYDAFRELAAVKQRDVADEIAEALRAHLDRAGVEIPDVGI